MDKVESAIAASLEELFEERILELFGAQPQTEINSPSVSPAEMVQALRAVSDKLRTVYSQKESDQRVTFAAGENIYTVSSIRRVTEDIYLVMTEDHSVWIFKESTPGVITRVLG